MSNPNPPPAIDNLTPRRDRYAPEEVIAAIRACKGIVTQAAKRLGCTPRTVDLYAARWPDVAEALEDERRVLIDTAEVQLWKSVNAGDWEAVKFVLKTLGKERGYVERTERTGAAGGPLQHAVTVPVIREVIVHAPPPEAAAPAETAGGGTIGGADDGGVTDTTFAPHAPREPVVVQDESESAADGA